MSDRPVGIHITSDPDVTRVEQPDIEGAHEAGELPLRLLLAADLAPQQEVDWADASHIHRVDKHYFADVLSALAPRLDIEVPNRLGDAPRLLEVELSFSSMADFRPGGLVVQVPPLKRLKATRDLVDQMQRQDIELAAFRERLVEVGVDQGRVDELCEALTARPEEPRTGRREPPRSSGRSRGEDDALSRLLGMVDAGEDEADGGDESSSPALVDALVGAAAGASRPTTRKDAADTLIADLDARIGRQLNEVVNHPELRRLEAAWRGLKFLVDRIDFRADIELDVLSVPKPELDEALYHQVLLPEHQGDSARSPLTAVVVDAAFDHGAADIGLLGDIAETAASLQVPVVASVAPSFFGAETHAGLTRLPLLWQHLERPEYVKWRALRDRPEAENLALVVPAFLLRSPYGADHPAGDLVYQEEGHLWGNGALIAALTMADSFAQTGSVSHVRGRVVEDLPLWKTDQGPTPLAALLPADKQRELADAGFAVLSARRDAVTLTHAPMIKRTTTMDDVEATTEARVHASLPCRLFVARAAHLLLLLQDGVEVDTSVDEAREMVADRFRRWLGTSGEEAEKAVLVEHVAEAQTPEFDVLAVRLQPPADMLEDRVRLVLGFRVARHARERDRERPSV